ncbi:hypothetical protein [Dongia rigui]|uniref:Uncharacterized protein n=1 Tax=Dongia rigui TaxID=940149 RepID=A0ABU5DYA3_9PROT|nr:hypothetical protein [Dongia rigui]MDY0872244.1 hypothetical protein [Dongia rigui]
MAEIGPLLLPPPAVYSGRSVAPARGASGGRQSGDDSAYLATVDATADATGGGAKAKQFRFRVLDGGRSDTLGNAELPATSRQPDAADDTSRAALGREGNAGGGKQLPLGTFSAPFMAQLIAQEQLQAGLHDPPIKQADRAYRQAGGEPALNDPDNSVARFKIAV